MTHKNFTPTTPNVGSCYTPWGNMPDTAKAKTRAAYAQHRRDRTFWLARVEQCQRNMDTQATKAALDRLRAATCAMLACENELRGKINVEY